MRPGLLEFDLRKAYIAGVVLLAFSYSGTTVWLLKAGIPTGPANMVIKAVIAGLFFTALPFTLARLDRLFGPLLPVLVLFAVYALRLLFDVLVRDILMVYQTPLYALGYFFGLTLLPVVALCGAVRASDVRQIDRWTFALLLFANLSILVHALTADLDSLLEVFAGRLQVEGKEEDTSALNPIGIGLSGACLAALAMGRLAVFGNQGAAWIALHLFALALGAGNILLGASRGPAIAFLACLLAMMVTLLRPVLLATSGGVRLRPVAWLYLLLPVVIVASLIGREDMPIFLLDRFTTFLEDRRAGVNELRDAIHAAAWQDFLGSPLVGSSYVVSLERSSPHNVVYEALISAGVLGAIALAWAMTCLALGVWRAWRGDAGPHGYPLALIGICLFVLQFTSGSIGQFPEFWVFTSLLVVLTARSARSVSSTSEAPSANRRRSHASLALRKID
jgi:hypothetical protein